MSAGRENIGRCNVLMLLESFMLTLGAVGVSKENNPWQEKKKNPREIVKHGPGFSSWEEG